MLVGACLAVLVAEQAPRPVKLDMERGAQIRRTRDQPVEQLAYAVEAAATGAVLVLGVWLIWAILGGDRRR
jgi:hypothetical protein